jgi:transposase-like protein
MGAETKVSTDGALKAAVERTKREAVEKVLAQANGNVAEAAAILGIVRPSLYRIMKRYGIATQTPTPTLAPTSTQTETPTEAEAPTQTETPTQIQTETEAPTQTQTKD